MHNAKRYVGEAIESALADPWEPKELIVVDDGSTDDGAKVVRRIGARVRLITQENQGTAGARNTAIRSSTGEFFAFLDADDLWPKGRLTLLMEALLSDPELEAVFGRTSQFLSPDLPLESRRALYCPEEPVDADLVCAMAIRRAAFEAVGAFSPELQVGVDMDWILRAKEIRLRVGRIPQVVLKRRIHSGNKGIVKRQHFNERLHILKRALDRRRASRPSQD